MAAPIATAREGGDDSRLYHPTVDDSDQDAQITPGPDVVTMGTVTRRIQLEILVILAATAYVLFEAWNTFSVRLSACVTVCLCCQFLTLTLKTYVDNQQPHIRQLFRSKADLGYLCSILVPLTVVADLVYIAQHNVFIDMLEWLDEYRKTLDDIVDIWGLDHRHKAQVFDRG